MKGTIYATAAALGIALNASAIPSLQIDVSPGTYDNTSSSTIASSSSFTLYALLQGTTVPTGDTFDVAVGLEPKQTTSASLGSFVFGGTTVNVTSGMTFGNPGLPPHGIYDTYYTLFPVNFSTGTKFTDYDVSGVTGNHTGPVANPTTGDSLFASFSVNVSGLASGEALWFDLIEKDANGNVIDNSPFSHAGQSGPNGNVPDGGTTVLLLGAAISGLGLIRRKLS